MRVAVEAVAAFLLFSFEPFHDASQRWHGTERSQRPSVRLRLRIEILMKILGAETESRQAAGWSFAFNDRWRESVKHRFHELPEAQSAPFQMIRDLAEREDAGLADLARRAGQIGNPP